MNNKYFIHPSSIVDTKRIGSDTNVWAFVHILKGARIGKKVNICDHCFIENEVVVGDSSTIKCGVWVWDGVTIENKVFVGPSVVFTNDIFPRSKNLDFKKKNTVLREGCSIGANSTLLAGIVVGAYSMIGAGSVVTKDVGDFELVYGNPARPRGFVCKCGGKINFYDGNAECDCGLKYSYKNNKVLCKP